MNLFLNIKQHNLMLAFFLILSLSLGCFGSNEEKSDEKVSITGYIQKGPFSEGTQIIIQELDPNLNPLGLSYTTTTTDNLGSYSSTKQPQSEIVEIVATGTYFDELTGYLTNYPITLRAYGTLSQCNVINVNVLTTIARDRIRYLSREEGKSLPDAIIQAEKEILKIFNISIENLASFNQMNIGKLGDSNAVLLAISCILLESNSAIKVEEFINNISTDIKEDGKLDDQSLLNQIHDNSILLAKRTISPQVNLSKFYGTDVPSIYNFIEKNGDGQVTQIQIDPIEDADFYTPYISEKITVTLPPYVDSAQATVDSGTLVINGKDTKSASTYVVNGDKVAISLTSGPDESYSVQSILEISFYNFIISGIFNIRNRSSDYFDLNFPMIENVDLNTQYLSSESTVVLPKSITSATATVSKLRWGNTNTTNVSASVVVNGVDTGKASTSVKSGDKIAIKALSGTTYGTTYGDWDEWKLTVEYLNYRNSGYFALRRRMEKYFEININPITDGISSTAYLSDATLIYLPPGITEAIAAIDNGTLVVNGTEISGYSAKVKNGDSIKINLLSGKYYNTTVKSNLIITFLDIREEGIFSLTTLPFPWIKASTSSIWSARRDHTSVVFKDRMWVIGGLNQYYNKLADVWSSTDGIHWNQETFLAEWSGRCGHTSVVFKNKIWVIGGISWDTDNIKNDVWSSEDGINWSLATSSAPWSPRYEHTSFVYQDKIWVVGGNGGKSIYNNFNDVWYTEDGVNWVNATTSAGWSPRYSHASVMFNGKMWILGGYGEKDCKDIWSSADGKDWKIESNMPNLTSRSDFASLIFENRIWIFGGLFDNNRDSWCSRNGISWIKIASENPWHRRFDHTAIEFNNKIWIIGGSIAKDFDSVPTNDIWYSNHNSNYMP